MTADQKVKEAVLESEDEESKKEERVQTIADDIGLDVEIVKAALELGIDEGNIAEAYQGEWNSDEDFVQNLLEDCGDIPKDLPLYVHIDWEWTAKEVMMDYSEQGGYYFRQI